MPRLTGLPSKINRCHPLSLLLERVGWMGTKWKEGSILSMSYTTIFKAQSHLSHFILVTAQWSGQKRSKTSIFRGDFNSEVKGLFQSSAISGQENMGLCPTQSKWISKSHHWPKITFMQAQTLYLLTFMQAQTLYLFVVEFCSRRAENKSWVPRTFSLDCLSSLLFFLVFHKQLLS